ncbi:Yip1 family protein [Kroppenstedtia eburnea]|uniref:Yip1 domain-containing protein n=1 Tax=Kroppenstedtia eburnea TaxID=714067 RepID=A0A1N7MY41_9BACL|nr:Yip1 family protein [Kroppenstedtia eburnea]QKI80715.1 YIP1 family protein [Kroppenstedtia eburnea]SIS90799.1 Yip1 domain-containing protein [Kroppenstedtia eburnea]
MNQVNQVFETPEPSRELNPWFSMWLRPRETVRQIMWTKSHSYHWIWLLLVLVGADALLDSASGRDLGDTMPVPLIFIFSFILGPITTAIGWAFFTLLVMLSGKILGGKATFKEVSLATGWGMVPMAWGLLLWIPELILFGESLFMEDLPGLDGIVAVLFLLFFSFVEIVLVVWSLVITVGGVAEVYGFSNLKGLGTCALAALFMAIPTFLLLMLVAVIGLVGMMAV